MSMNIRQALARVVERIDLSRDEMQDVMQAIMTGQCSDAQIAALLVALRMKGESIDEIEGAARVMRDLAARVTLSSHERVVDIVGTGGDGANLFNVSSASAFVVAAGGGRVAKHGNRAVSSKSGSADLLETAGINLALTPEQVARCIDSVGVGFLFAVNHHGAMKHAIGARREIVLVQREAFAGGGHHGHVIHDRRIEREKAERLQRFHILQAQEKKQQSLLEKRKEIEEGIFLQEALKNEQDMYESYVNAVMGDYVQNGREATVVDKAARMKKTV